MLGNVVLDSAVVADASRGKDVRNAIDGAGGHEADVVGWVEERDLTHTVEVKIVSEVGKGFELGEGEVGTEVVAKGGGEAQHI